MTLSNTRLAVRRDPLDGGWAIVSPVPLRRIVGRVHGAADPFPGRWVYPFTRWETAMEIARSRSSELFFAHITQQAQLSAQNEILDSKAPTHPGLFARLGWMR